MTLTIPVLLAAEWIVCIVPAKTKAAASRIAIEGGIDESCPESVLRRHRDHIRRPRQRIVADRP